MKYSLGIPLYCDLFPKRRDQKNFLIWQEITGYVSPVRWSVKHFLAPNSLDIPAKSWKRGWTKPAITRKINYRKLREITTCSKFQVPKIKYG